MRWSLVRCTVGEVNLPRELGRGPAYLAAQQTGSCRTTRAPPHPRTKQQQQRYVAFAFPIGNAVSQPKPNAPLGTHSKTGIFHRRFTHRPENERTVTVARFIDVSRWVNSRPTCRPSTVARNYNGNRRLDCRYLRIFTDFISPPIWNSNGNRLGYFQKRS